MPQLSPHKRPSPPSSLPARDPYALHVTPEFLHTIPPYSLPLHSSPPRPRADALPQRASPVGESHQHAYPDVRCVYGFLFPTNLQPSQCNLNLTLTLIVSTDNLSSLDALVQALKDLDDLFVTIDDAYSRSLKNDTYERWSEES